MGQFRIIRIIGKNAAVLGLPVSWLVHPASHVSLLLPTDEGPPQLRRASVVPEPVAENAYVMEAILDHREPVDRDRPGLAFHILWLDGTTSCEPEEDSAGAARLLRSTFEVRWVESAEPRGP